LARNSVKKNSFPEKNKERQRKGKWERGKGEDHETERGGVTNRRRSG